MILLIPILVLKSDLHDIVYYIVFTFYVHQSNLT